jgi:hypothetical protein
MDVRREMEELYPSARALFGEELGKLLEELNHNFHKVKTYADAQRQDTGSDQKFSDKINTVLLEGWLADEEQENFVDVSIADTVKKIESICLPIVNLD